MPESLLDLLSPADLPLQLGRYELQCILGEGGMARVFGAELIGPAGFRKQVAVKVIKQGAFDQEDGNHVASFIREARLGGLLKHPNIVDVYEFGEADAQLFIAMERVEGQTLDQIIRSGEKPPPAVVLEIAAGVAAGLASAHSLNSEGLTAGLVHRDMKPSNVMVSWNGAVKVADFGIAITRYGELAEPGRDWSDVAGTLSYMSSEQLRGEPLDGRSDLFSLGLVLVELSTATRLPRRYLYKRLVSGRQLQSPVIPDEYLAPVEEAVPGFRRILERCLDPEPGARYASAEELLSAIESLRQRLGFFPRLRTWLQAAGQPPPMNVVGAKTFALQTEPTGVTEPQSKSSPTRDLLSRTNLGEPLDGFVGRESELAELEGRFEAGARLITVKGTGGSGKTRFACRLARGRSDGLAGGAWFVDLTEARTPVGVVHAVAMVLGIPLVGEGLDALVLQVGHAIAGRGPVLLVLDNFEQIVDCAAITVGRWLNLAPEANFLATSRSPLRLAGEQVFELEPLPEPDGVRLFELRARATGANWREDSKTRTAITQIVEAVDGLPLAIELAAARAVLLSPTQLLERLSERFKLLRAGGGGNTDRQSTLRGLIRWSWDLLDPWEQAALTQLSVFRDGFFMEAAEDVLDLSAWPDAPWLLDVVGSLLDKSLLHRWEVRGQPRFGMYTSIQEYAAEKLGEQAAGTRLGHAQHFATFGTEAFLESLDSHGGVTRRKLLTLELENLLAGVEGGLASGDVEAAACCALAGAEVFQLQGPYSDGIALLEGVSGLPVVQETRERLYRHSGSLMHLAGRFSDALKHIEQSLDCARETGNRRGEGISLGQLAWLHREQGRVSESLEHTLQALEAAREAGDRRTQGTALGNLGLVHYEQGRLPEAVEHYQQALVIAQELGNQRHEGVTLGNLALLHQEQGRLPEALGYFQEALSVARRVGNRRSEGVTLGNIAHIHRNQGHIPEALAHYRRALAVAREVGNCRSEGVTLGNLGDFLFSQGEVSAAESHLRDAISISDESYPIAAGAFRGSLALICAQSGALEEARSLLVVGEPQVRGVYRMELGKFLCKKARVEYLAGDRDATASAIAEAEAIAAEMEVLPESQLGRALAQAYEAISS